MDLFSELLIFAKVVEAGSFSAAAEQLGLAKSSVSKKVAALEARYNVRLIYRTTRQLSITEDGQALYERCQRLQEEFEETRAQLEQLPAEPRGKLRIGAPPLFTRTRLLPLITEFMQSYPELELGLQLADTYSDMIAEGFDALIRMGEQPDSSMIAHRISELQPILCASPKYLEIRGTPKTPADLKQHDCLIWQRDQQGNTPQEWAFYHQQQRVLMPVYGIMSSNDTEALMHAATQSLGIALLPDFLVEEHINSGTLVALLPSYQHPPVPIYLMYSHRKQLPAKLSVFVDFLRKRMQH